jgi:hypothetical protein
MSKEARIAPAGAEAEDERRPGDPCEALGGALNLTRKIRFGLEVMWSEVDFLPDEIRPPEEVLKALGTIRDWLETVEEGELRDAPAGDHLASCDAGQSDQ